MDSSVSNTSGRTLGNCGAMHLNFHKNTKKISPPLYVRTIPIFTLLSILVFITNVIQFIYNGLIIV